MSQDMDPNSTSDQSDPTVLPTRAVVFEEAGRIRLGRLDGDDVVVDAGPADDHGFHPTPAGWEVVRRADGPRYQLSELNLIAPVRPGKVIAIGINYREHAAESHNDIPDEPVVFAKFPSSVIGPNETIIVPREETRPDWEGEMAVVVGTPIYRATPATARSCIGAFTALNDVSGRRAQLETPLQQFTLGKSFDTFTPIGPCLVEPTGVDLGRLRLTTDVNGERMQDASTSQMIFDAAELIEHVSRGMSLEPGDVIATGTPSGVGNRMDPPRYLREGDIVEVSVTHVGTLRNPVSLEP
jgi:2-keto-4-pentenoate hydratase/2-oxohepta-3-ene-1,7-dioic acid hydratase in catechol pathway